ncbi:MAG: DUF1836 domain-containing protein [Bacillota bacterium]|nr:DUF1836 domain-containing protein [Bacillota bacterium]
MMSLYDDMLNYHCPRWHELPDIDLYMDQVVTILGKNLECFTDGEGSKIITSTMVNNYVKQKVIKPPKNKKYDRSHLSYLFLVCILKQIMGISEICDSIAFVLQSHEISAAYDIFCDILEEALKNVFTDRPPVIYNADDPSELKIIKSVIASFATLQYSRYLIKKTLVK